LKKREGSKRVKKFKLEMDSKRRMLRIENKLNELKGENRKTEF